MKLVFFDYESATVDEVGNPTASTEAYRHDFRVMSAAFAWVEGASLKTLFTDGEEETGKALQRFVDEDYRCVVHNLSFELMVTQCRYPSFFPRVQWHADTMRLVQLYDNAADEFIIDWLSDDQELNLLDVGEAKKKPKPKYIGGLKLDNAVRRLLGDKTSHKEEAHSWLRDNAGIKKGSEGANLHLLPRDILERYNVADAVNTMRLYEYITHHFKSIGFNWEFNHRLYDLAVKRYVRRKIKGVRVDVEHEKAYAKKVTKEIEDTSAAFLERFKDEIKRVERARLLAEIRKRKTLRGRKRFLRRFKLDHPTARKAVRFNTGSNKQLAALFVDVLGIEPRFRTDKGAPSFRSVVLDQWGDGGLLLQKRRKRLLVLKQAEALIRACEYDGRWHYDFRVAGTATGRGAGGKS